MVEGRSALQDLSKTLFGQVHRLSVMIAVARSNGSVNPTDLASELGLPQSALQAPLRDLVEAGLLSRTTDGRRNVYIREKSKVWAWVAEVDSVPSASGGNRTPRNA